MLLVDLNLKAARKRQSPQTHFVHLCYEDVEQYDTIPLYENFCFALALFRSRIAENVLEAKTLLEKLLAFQSGENFPVYLHEYPVCRDGGYTSRKIFLVLHWIWHDFSSVLGEDLRSKINALLRQPEPPSAPDSPEKWAEFLMVAQVLNIPLEAVFEQWSPTLMTYLGKQKQEGQEPAVTLLDLFMGQACGVWSRRALQDHLVHLQAALVRPFVQSLEAPLNQSTPAPFVHLPGVIYWGDKEKLHSLYVEGEQENFLFTLVEKEVSDQIEIALYCNCEGNKILINDQKATTFHFEDQIEIFSTVFIKIQFFLVEGSGRFFGQILRANRPGQVSCKGQNRFEAYDWKIALRTVHRQENCQVKCLITI